MTGRGVVIGFLPRERFSVAGESLASLVDHTPGPFRLLVVDPAIPDRYRDEMAPSLARCDDVDVLRADRHLLPAAAKNLVLDASDGCEHLVLVENDVLFSDGWLECLLAAVDEFPADVAAPLIREGRGELEHFDRLLGSVVDAGDGTGRLRIEPLRAPRGSVTGRTKVDFVEQHCLLFRREVFDRIGPFDEELNTRDEIDLSLALHHAGATVVLEPEAVVNYVPPSAPPEPDELAFYGERWDIDRAVRSRERIRARWNLVETPGDLGFVRYRNLIPAIGQVRAELAELCERGRVVVLDNGEWIGSEPFAGLPLVPFPHRDGQWWGYPASDGDAVAELDRVLAEGARYVVVGWPAAWWLDHLPGLRRRLDELSLVAVDDRLAVREAVPA